MKYRLFILTALVLGANSILSVSPTPVGQVNPIHEVEKREKVTKPVCKKTILATSMSLIHIMIITWILSHKNFMQ